MLTQYGYDLKDKPLPVTLISKVNNGLFNYYIKKNYIVLQLN